ncbi:MAG: hypothetical protein J5892_05210 [Bacilli bacterium]|nr:hypothetical protein [Bacilli bacterium]
MKTNEIKNKLESCRNINLEDVNPNEIDDIKDIKIDKRKSSNDRLLDFLSTVKNPYIFKVNGRLVQIVFSDTDKTADDCLTNVLNKLYK